MTERLLNLSIFDHHARSEPFSKSTSGVSVRQRKPLEQLKKKNREITSSFVAFEIML